MDSKTIEKNMLRSPKVAQQQEQILHALGLQQIPKYVSQPLPKPQEIYKDFEHSGNLYVAGKYHSYRKNTSFRVLRAFEDYYDALDFITTQVINKYNPDYTGAVKNGRLWRNEEIDYQENSVLFSREFERNCLIKICGSTGYDNDVYWIYRVEGPHFPEKRKEVEALRKVREKEKALERKAKENVNVLKGVREQQRDKFYAATEKWNDAILLLANTSGDEKRAKVRAKIKFYKERRIEESENLKLVRAELAQCRETEDQVSETTRKASYAYYEKSSELDYMVLSHPLHDHKLGDHLASLTMVLKMEAIQVNEDECFSCITMDRPFLDNELEYVFRQTAPEYCHKKALQESQDDKVHDNDFDQWKSPTKDLYITNLGKHHIVGTQGKHLWSWQTVPIIPKQPTKYCVLVETDKALRDKALRDKALRDKALRDKDNNQPHQTFHFLQHQGNEQALENYNDECCNDKSFIETGYRVSEQTALEMCQAFPKRCFLHKGPLGRDPLGRGEMKQLDFALPGNYRGYRFQVKSGDTEIWEYSEHQGEFPMRDIVTKNTVEEFSKILSPYYGNIPYFQVREKRERERERKRKRKRKNKN